MGPCLTDAARGAHFRLLFSRRAATRRSERQPRRSLRQLASVGSWPPHYSDEGCDFGLPPNAQKVSPIAGFVKPAQIPLSALFGRKRGGLQLEARVPLPRLAPFLTLVHEPRRP